MSTGPVTAPYNYDDGVDRPYFIFRRSDKKQLGPYSSEELLRALNAGKFNRVDYVYHDGLEDWRPFFEVFEIHDGVRHENDGQNEKQVHDVFLELTQLLPTEEQIYYIAIQKPIRWWRMMRPAAMAVANTGVAVLRTGLSGERNFDFFHWRQIRSIRYRQHSRAPGCGSLGWKLPGGKSFRMDSLPLPQISKVVKLMRELRDED